MRSFAIVSSESYGKCFGRAQEIYPRPKTSSSLRGQVQTDSNTNKWLRSWGACSNHRGLPVEGGWRLAGRKTVVLSLIGYRRFISPFLPPACRFYPTCSVYGAEAVAQHGVARGLLLTVTRVLRCHPFNRGGYDPVPPVDRLTHGGLR